MWNLVDLVQSVTEDDDQNAVSEIMNMTPETMDRIADALEKTSKFIRTYKSNFSEN